MTAARYPCSASVLKALLEGSGLTWSELCHSFGFEPHEHHGGPMEIAQCLWDLNHAGLIQVDGISGTCNTDISRFVREQLSESYREETDTPDRRIRASENWRHIQRVFSLDLSTFDIPKDLYSLTVHPFFGKPTSLPTRAEIFVLMPFKDELLPIYKDHIVNVTSSLKLSVMRADDLFTSNSVVADIWAGILGARAVIADCTGRNPNVFYEIGIAHAIGKPVILVTQAPEDVPVDLRHIKYILYKYNPRGMIAFESSLSETLSAVLQLSERVAPNPADRADGKQRRRSSA